MQDCYVGDIGDYGKFALLREMHRQGLSIGINWYKTDAITSEKQNDGKYCIPDRLTVYDTDLSTRLKKIFYSQDSIVRSIKALEAEQLIGGALYYSDCVPVGHREKWHQHALSALSGSDLVFLDPDNGMIVSSAEKDKQKQRKYVLDAEFKDYLCTGHSVVIYQHRPRVNEAVYIDKVRLGDVAIEVRETSRLLTELLPFIISNDAFFDYAMEKSAGSLSPRVKWAQLAEYEFDLPELEEQQKLANLLWAMERTRKAYQDLLIQADELAKSQFVEMFGDPILTEKDETLTALSDSCILKAGKFIKADDISDTRQDGQLRLVCSLWRNDMRRVSYGPDAARKIIRRNFALQRK